MDGRIVLVLMLPVVAGAITASIWLYCMHWAERRREPRTLEEMEIEFYFGRDAAELWQQMERDKLRRRILGDE